MDSEQLRESKTYAYRRINEQHSWDVPVGMTLEQRIQGERDRIIREEMEKGSLHSRMLEKKLSARIDVFQVAKGTPVQNLQPAQKAACSKRMQYTQTKIARKEVDSFPSSPKESVQLRKTLNYQSYQIHNEIIAFNQEQQNSIDYSIIGSKGIGIGAQRNLTGLESVLRHFTQGLRVGKDVALTEHEQQVKKEDEKFLIDYITCDVNSRAPHLRRIMENLLGQEVNQTTFSKKGVMNNPREAYRIAMQYHDFKTLYSDPINKPFFDGLTVAEKALMKVRILDVADDYYQAMSYVFKSCGLDLRSGDYFTKDSELTYSKKEEDSYAGIGKVLHHRDEQSIQIVSAHLEELVTQEKTQLLRESDEMKQEVSTDDRLKNLRDTGLTDFVTGFSFDTVAECRDLIVKNPNVYRAHKEIFDQLQNLIFRTVDSMGSLLLRSNALCIHQQNLELIPKEKRTIIQINTLHMIDRESAIYDSKLDLLRDRVNRYKDTIKAMVSGSEIRDPKILRTMMEQKAIHSTAFVSTLDRLTARWTRLSPGEQAYTEGVTVRRRQPDETYFVAFTGNGSSIRDNGNGDVLAQRLRVYEQMVALIESGEMEEFRDGKCVKTSKGSVERLDIERLNKSILTLSYTHTLNGKELECYRLLNGWRKRNEGEQDDSERDAYVESGLRILKAALYEHLLNLEQKYGTLLTQLHPEDVIDRMDLPSMAMDFATLQDINVLMDQNHTGVALFDYTSREDKRFKDLAEYFFHTYNSLQIFFTASFDGKPDDIAVEMISEQMRQARDMESVIGGPAFSEEDKEEYRKHIQVQLRQKGSVSQGDSYGRW